MRNEISCSYESVWIIHTIITEKLYLCKNTILFSLKFALSIAQQSHGNQTDKSHMIPSKMMFKWY